MRRRWYWPWTRRHECSLHEAERAIARASRDAEELQSQWPEVRALRRRADAVATKVEKVYDRNGFSEMFWGDMRGKG